MTRHSGEGMYAPGAGYGTLNVVRTPDGPAIEGEVPNRIGVEREALVGMVPRLGSWDEHTGVLIVCDVRFRLIGADGTEILVFQRETA